MARKVNVNPNILKVKSNGFLTVKNISFKQVQSSNIKGYLYFAKKRQLYILFNNNRIYIYKGISAYKMKKFRDAPSKGSYFHTSIRFKHTYKEL